MWEEFCTSAWKRAARSRSACSARWSSSSLVTSREVSTSRRGGPPTSGTRAYEHEIQQRSPVGLSTSRMVGSASGADAQRSRRTSWPARSRGRRRASPRVPMTSSAR